MVLSRAEMKKPLFLRRPKLSEIKSGVLFHPMLSGPIGRFEIG
jgi:hypothetical protein